MSCCHIMGLFDGDEHATMTEGLKSPSVLTPLYVRGHGAHVFLGVEKKIYPEIMVFITFLTVMIFFRKNITEVSW